MTVRCQSCGAPVGILMGLPTAVYFDAEEATVNVDLCELPVFDSEADLVCECADTSLNDADTEALVAMARGIQQAHCEVTIPLKP